MNEKDFKAKNKPATCTKPPWAKLIYEDERNRILAKIRAESNEYHGRSLDECPKRHVCMGKSCLGRPLPWKSLTAKPYLEKLKLTHNIVNGELFIKNCDNCSFANKCTSPCSQVNDFVHRDKKKEATLVYKDKLDNLKISVEGEIIHLPMLEGLEIPWDCVSQRKQNVVRKYLYQRIDFLTIANQEGLGSQEKSKYEYYSALTKMSEYAIMRRFIEERGHILRPTQLEIVKRVYIENKTISDSAKEIGITKSAAFDRIKRIRVKYKLTWHKFVKKKKIGNKIKTVYYIPEVLR